MSDYNDPFGLEDADTPEEIAEDNRGWQYTDEDIDQMEQEQNERAITERPFPKPLSQNDQLLIELVTKRYVDRDAPFVKVETETEVILRIPKTIVRRTDIPEDTDIGWGFDEQVQSEAV